MQISTTRITPKPRTPSALRTHEDGSTFSSDDFISSPAAKALGGAILGAIPGIGFISNGFFTHTCAANKLSDKNMPLALALSSLNLVGMAANLMSFSGVGGPAGVALTLGFSGLVSGLGAMAL